MNTSLYRLGNWLVLFIVVIAIARSLASCNKSGTPPSGNVYMEDGAFFLDGEPFHPMVMNYIINLQTNGHDIWAAPYQGYTPGYRFAHRDRDSCLMLLLSDMMHIRELGFNTLRIVKLAEGPVRDRSSGDLYLKTFLGNEKDTLLALDNEGIYTRYRHAIDEVMQVARKADMKIILLTSLHANDHQMTGHWRKVAAPLANEPAILAFDLFNEPLYFDSLERTKKDVHRIVKDWRKLMREHAPHHLFTIGLQGIREVFEWDPNILDVDFISFHPYEYETEQVRNEMRWFHENVDVPWIIGETSLPADNDSVPYSVQSEFAVKVLQQAYACGAAGFSWWQYKDVEWGEFHSDHMGLVSLHGETTVSGAPLAIRGTPKPASRFFKEFDPNSPRGECVLLPNYANYSQHTTSMLTGRLLDIHGDPIEGGVVIAWNEHWSRSYHTISEADGSFRLRGNFYFHHWMASASKYSMVRGDCNPNTFFTRDEIPEFYIGELRLEKLSFVE